MTPFTVSNHSLGIILSCQRAGYFYKVLKRVKVVEEKPGADAGSAGHAVLARYYGEAVSMNTACQALADHNPGDDYRTPAYLTQAYTAYEKHWGDDRATFKTLAVEMPFSIKLNDWLTWEGRIDRVYEHPDGRVVVQDHKTGKDYGQRDLDRFARNPALPGYCTAVTQVLGRPCVTAELNSITIRQPLVKERADSKPRFEFHRATYMLDNDVQAEWRENTIRAVTAFLQAVETDTVLFNANSCVNGFGRCPYFDVCEQTPNARLTMLATDMYRDYTPPCCCD